MIGTTKEQSKHLIELGLDPETADMCVHDEDGIQPFPYKSTPLNERNEFQPMWSLDKLMKLMPAQINYKGQFYELELSWYDERLYYKKYGHSVSDSLHAECADDYVDACCKMIAWLLNENVIGCGLK